MRRCRLKGAEIPAVLPERAGAESLLGMGNEAGTPPESVIARGFVPWGPGLFPPVVITGEGKEPFLEVV